MLACDFADKAGRQLGATAAICAWEDAAHNVKRNIERFARSPEDQDGMKGHDMRVYDLLQRTFRLWRHPSLTRDIAWFKERALLLFRRNNCRFFVFDPWNQHDEAL